MKDRFALHVAPDGDSVAGPEPMGQHAASAPFLRAAAQGGLAAIACFGADEARAADCERALREHGFEGEVERVAAGKPRALERFGVLHHPGPAIERLAWRRLGIGERRYSLCGVAHSLASHAAMSGVAGLLAAPLRSWDALVCSSRVVRDGVREVLERQAEYLRARLGAQRFELPQLPLIPPGVHAGDFVFDQSARMAARQRFGIGDGELAILAMAGPGFHAAPHPQQMFSALGRGAAGRQLHLILCGGFGGGQGEQGEQALREAAAQLCPSVRLVLADGRAAGDRAQAWAAADVFTSLADKLGAGEDLAPLEAMAAGLPCVVSDWAGYRDMVRDGVDGYRIATVMPGAGAGLDLAQRYDDGIDSYDEYCGHTSQAVALDGAQLAQAYGDLIHDAGLRGRMGESGRRHVREAFDWQVVFARYRALWSELDERRRADAVLGPALPQALPDRLDPYALCASHASAQLAPRSLVALAPDASLALLRQYRELEINRHAVACLPTLEEFGLIFGSIGSRPTQVDELLDTLGPCDRPTLQRGLVWLCKMDLLRIGAPDAQ